MNLVLIRKTVIISSVILVVFFIFAGLNFIFNPRKSSPIDNKQVEKSSPGDLCNNLQLSGKILSNAKSLNLTTRAKSSNIKTFVYTFSNKDNLSHGSKPYPLFINFEQDNHFVINHDTSHVSSDKLVLTYADFDKPDLNWNNQKPKHIQVDVYLEDDKANRSVTDPKCETSFDVE